MSYVTEIPRNYVKHTAGRALPMVQRTTSSTFECVGAYVIWVVLAIWESRRDPTALISFIGYRFEFRVPARRPPFPADSSEFRALSARDCKLNPDDVSAQETLACKDLRPASRKPELARTSLGPLTGTDLFLYLHKKK